MHLLSSSINCDLQICSAVTLTNIIMNWIKRELKCCEVNIVWKSDLSKFRGAENSTFVKSRQMYFPNKAGTEFLKKVTLKLKSWCWKETKFEAWEFAVRHRVGQWWGLTCNAAESFSAAKKGTGYSERPGKVMEQLWGTDTSSCSNRLKIKP